MRMSWGRGMKRPAARGGPAAIAIVALLLAAGCGDDKMTTPDPEPEGIPTDVTTPEEMLASHQAAWVNRDAGVYAALLTTDFHFELRDDDVGNFPWAPNGFWDRLEEVTIMGNLLDPAYQGSEPAVESIDLDYLVASTQVIDPTTTEVTVDISINLITGPSAGYNVDTRLVLELVKQTDDVLRIRRMHEVQIFEPAGARAGLPVSAGRVENSLGSVKARYRE